MKILKLIIKEYQQFKDIELNFTNNETGEVLDKICFIGKNATGKSTLLELIYFFLKDVSNFKSDGFIVFKIEITNKQIYFVNKNFSTAFFQQEIEKEENWTDRLFAADFKLFEQETSPLFDFTGAEFRKYKVLKIQEIYDATTFVKNADDLLIYLPAESKNNQLIDLKDVPETNVNEALKLFDNLDYQYEISNDTVDKFWTLLLFQIKKREKEWTNYQNEKENENKTIKELKDNFNKKYPEILKEISLFWNKILAPADLYFDYENANTPVQLTDNLQTYIKTKLDTNNLLQENIIPYGKLSTGIRNYIFKVGYIFSLYFNRKINRSFLLVDEPENSLFPDFLYDLIDDIYLKIIDNQNTQFFVATHNPIIATQFEPEERIILDFDTTAYVTARKGTVPVGDDPNDILFREFNMRSIYTKKGLINWDRFVELEELIKNEQNPQKKIQLMDEYLKIGTNYNFPVSK